MLPGCSWAGMADESHVEGIYPGGPMAGEDQGGALARFNRIYSNTVTVNTALQH
jgi:hypothetical protein